MAQPITHSIAVAARPETAEGGSAHSRDPRVASMRSARITPALTGTGGRIDAMAIKTAEVVAAMVQLIPDSALPSESVKSKTTESPSIVIVRRIFLGSPVAMSWSMVSSL